MPARIAAPLLLLAPVFAQASFTPLGGASVATGISPDGQWVTGTAAGNTFLWDATNGFVNPVSLPPNSNETECSTGGLFGCGTYANAGPGTTEAAQWTSTMGFTFLGGIGGQSGTSVSSAYGMNDAGNVIVGLGWINAGTAHGFKWTQGVGMTDLGSIFGTSSRANGVSGDGSVVVGWDGPSRQPVIWAGGVETRLGALGVNGEAWAASYDGSVITGMYQTEMFTWTVAGGMVKHGRLPGSAASDRAWGMDISDSAQTIVGYSGDQVFGSPFRAFVYRPNLGLIELQSFLTGLGVAIPSGWSLTSATGVSADGRTICGYGWNGTNNEGWIATIPPEGAMTNYCEPGLNGVISCPCANPPSGPGRGCDNSASTGGASIQATGMASITSDSIVITTANQRPSGTTILLQGTSDNGSGLPFGQGVRCVGGTLKRLYTKTASGGSITAPGVGDPSISARSAALGDPIAGGTTREYMAYYRDPIVLGGCPGSNTWNGTNAGQLYWNP